jgi:N4-bis(aminopropyl)spermidine synthase
VDLQEGASGVRRVLRAISELNQASARAVSDRAGLPVPIVAAVNNELRSRGVLDKQRPSRLTERGAALAAEVAPVLHFDPTCACCGGHGVQVPPELIDIVAELEAIAVRAPEADLTLDQSHSTAATKLRRVLALARYRVLPVDGVLFVGDDDLVSIAFAVVSARLGVPLARTLAVVDISRPVLDFIGVELDALGVSAELIEHDLRDPLPSALAERFELAVTDPPYTPAGAGLFLTRAVEGLIPGPGRTIALSFGPKGPRDALEVQDELGGLGLNSLVVLPDFNEYHGASVIGARSTLYLLGTTARTTPTRRGRYAGPLYTADARAADRWYLCLECRSRYEVGPHGRWQSINALKRAGCPNCGSTRFRPLSLVTESGDRAGDR